MTNKGRDYCLRRFLNSAIKPVMIDVMIVPLFWLLMIMYGFGSPILLPISFELEYLLSLSQCLDGPIYILELEQR